ncbi:MAG: zf-HC2 domain-containing protein [Nitrospirae bacterium]|nr:MAG: zf-HC2 domain-containing protein [Nitrospirota bacterium]
MRATPRVMTTRQTSAPSHHGHSKAQCIKVLRRLSAYLDEDLSVSICEEIRKHLGACPNCEVFVTSLRETISLCRCADIPSLSPSVKARIRREILKAVRYH